MLSGPYWNVVVFVLMLFRGLIRVVVVNVLMKSLLLTRASYCIFGLTVVVKLDASIMHGAASLFLDYIHEIVLC